MKAREDLTKTILSKDLKVGERAWAVATAKEKASQFRAGSAKAHVRRERHLVYGTPLPRHLVSALGS